MHKKTTYYSKNYFTHAFSDSERADFLATYGSPEWDVARGIVVPKKGTQMFSKLALKVAKVMKKHFKLDLLPVIKTVWSDKVVDEDCFIMVDKQGDEYWFHDSVDNFKAKNGYYTCGVGPQGDLEIYRER